MDISTVTPVINAAIGSAVIAYYWYINNQIDPTKETQPGYRLKKALPTVIVGTGIGALSVFANIEPLTTANVGVQMASYGLITSVVDTGLKTVWRWIQSKLGETKNVQ